MRLTLEAGQVRGCIALWREALAHRGHARGASQEELLTRVAATVTGWSDLLALCRADQGEDESFAQLRGELDRFKGWINEALLATKLVEDVQHLDERGLARRSQRSQKGVAGR